MVWIRKPSRASSPHAPSPVRPRTDGNPLQHSLVPLNHAWIDIESVKARPGITRALSCGSTFVSALPGTLRVGKAMKYLAFLSVRAGRLRFVGYFRETGAELVTYLPFLGLWQ